MSEHQPKWHVEVTPIVDGEIKNPTVDEFVTEIGEADLARFTELSKNGHVVEISAHARIRRLYKNGTILSDSPDLERFYLRPEDDPNWDKTCHAWTHFGAFPTDPL